VKIDVADIADIAAVADVADVADVVEIAAPVTKPAAKSSGRSASARAAAKSAAENAARAEQALADQTEQPVAVAEPAADYQPVAAEQTVVDVVTPSEPKAELPPAVTEVTSVVTAEATTAITGAASDPVVATVAEPAAEVVAPAVISSGGRAPNDPREIRRRRLAEEARLAAQSEADKSE
jgi:ribonuclease E